MGVTSVNSVSNNLDQAILVLGLTALPVGGDQADRAPECNGVGEIPRGGLSYLGTFPGCILPFARKNTENELLLGVSV